MFKHEIIKYIKSVGSKHNLIVNVSKIRMYKNITLLLIIAKWTQCQNAVDSYLSKYILICAIYSIIGCLFFYYFNDRILKLLLFYHSSVALS